jgi:ankyrin repeat protein
MNLLTLWQSIDESSGVKELAKFIAAGGDVNQPHPDSGWSLLHLASEHENLVLIAALVKAGADIDLRPPCGYPPIFQALDIDIDGAIQCGKEIDFRTTLLLLELGATPTARDENGNTLREAAAPYGDTVLAKFDEHLSTFLMNERGHR